MPQEIGQVEPVSCPYLEKKKTSDGQVSVMSGSELVNLMKGRDLILVDVRSPKEYKSQRLMKAINLPATPEMAVTKPDAKAVLQSVARMGKFVLRTRTKERKKTVVMSADGKDGPEDPARIIADVLSDAKDLYILDGGFKAFSQQYPMAVGKISLPWFPSVLLENILFLGSEDDAKHLAHLEGFGITHILNVSSDVKNYHENRFKYLRINLPDEVKSDLRAHFQKGFEFLKPEKGKRVLIHCHQGVSRSSTMTIAYLMHSKQWSLSDSYHFVLARLAKIRFWKQLAEFEIQLFGKTTIDDCIDLEKEIEEYQAKNMPDDDLGEEIGEHDTDGLCSRSDVDDSDDRSLQCEICTIL